MWISKIKIKNFRNYKNEEISLNNKINIIYGKNAQGKTNIIEAIYISSIGKSYRTKKERELIKFEEKNCEIEIDYKKTDRDGKIKIIVENKKNIFVNNIKIKKLSELLGNINIVIFTPEDINILKGSPQNRRKFLDVMISQLRPNYMHILNLYEKVIDERNTYLKTLSNEKNDYLEIYDEKLAEYGYEIFKYRKEFIEKIKNKIIDIHKKITEGIEEIKIDYTSNCEDKTNYLNLLKERKKIDIIKGYTTKGIHRDDFIMSINGLPVDVYCSQGQNRTAVLSLKLAELQVINDEIGENPILLLDDFMSELDEFRRKNFLDNIKDTQVIITCTEKIDLKDSKCYNIVDGKIIDI